MSDQEKSKEITLPDLPTSVAQAHRWALSDARAVRAGALNTEERAVLLAGGEWFAETTGNTDRALRRYLRKDLTVGAKETLPDTVCGTCLCGALMLMRVGDQSNMNLAALDQVGIGEKGKMVAADSPGDLMRSLFTDYAEMTPKQRALAMRWADLGGAMDSMRTFDILSGVSRGRTALRLHDTEWKSAQQRLLHDDVRAVMDDYQQVVASVEHRHDFSRPADYDRARYAAPEMSDAMWFWVQDRIQTVLVAHNV